MTATITDIKRFAVHDGDGIRTTVFFKGCPLRCVWCHNPETLTAAPQLAYFSHKCTGCGACAAVCPAHKMLNGTHALDRTVCRACGRCVTACPNDALKVYGRTVTVDEVLTILLEDKPFYDSSGGGITLSGGECLLQADFCAALLAQCKAHGLNTAVDTCGHVPRAALDAVIPYTDTFLYDLKAFDPAVHQRCTGATNERVLDNLRYLDEHGCRIEIRIPYVPQYNDTEIDKLAAFVKNLKNVVRVRVLPYHNYAASRYTALGMPDTLPSTIPTKDLCAQLENVFA